MRITYEASPANDSQRTAVAFFESLGDEQAMRALFSDDISWTIWGDFPFSGTHRGKEAVLTNFHAPAGQLFSQDDVGHITVTEIVGSGQTVAIEFNHMNRTALDRPYHNFYVLMVTVQGDQLAAVREYCDTEHLRHQCY